MLMISPEEGCRLLSDHLALNYEQDNWEVSRFACSLSYHGIILGNIASGGFIKSILRIFLIVSLTRKMNES